VSCLIESMVWVGVDIGRRVESSWVTVDRVA